MEQVFWSVFGAVRSQSVYYGRVKATNKAEALTKAKETWPDVFVFVER